MSNSRTKCDTSSKPDNQKTPDESGSACCKVNKAHIDYLLWIPVALVVNLYVLHLASPQVYRVFDTLGLAVYELINTMALGIVIGVVMVAALSYVPRELVISALGGGRGVKGLLRATAAGVLLDLCSHGILMVGSKLYERGVSTGQVMAFLIASPWNSLSLTIILVALIGLSWTLMFIVLSVIIAVITGLVFDHLVDKKILPENANAVDLPKDFRFWHNLKQELKKVRLTHHSVTEFIVTGLRESRMVIRWLLIGVLLAALIRTFVTDDHFANYFGPTLLGLAVTMFTATILEICSEGATPIAADIFNRAGAPGNGFAFLMAGVSTDYTEIMVLRDTTRSWRIALFLPLITLPQILFFALIINYYFI